MADATELPDLLHGDNTRGWGDQGYRGQREVIREAAPNALDFINRRYRHHGVVTEAEKARNRTKSKVRAKVEHCFGVIKRVCGFTKMGYRGLDKNAHRLFVTCAPANLFLARGRFLQTRRAESVRNTSCCPRKGRPWGNSRGNQCAYRQSRDRGSVSVTGNRLTRGSLILIADRSDLSVCRRPAYSVLGVML